MAMHAFTTSAGAGGGGGGGDLDFPPLLLGLAGGAGGPAAPEGAFEPLRALASGHPVPSGGLGPPGGVGLGDSTLTMSPAAVVEAGEEVVDPTLQVYVLEALGVAHFRLGHIQEACYYLQACIREAAGGWWWRGAGGGGVVRVAVKLPY